MLRALINPEPPLSCADLRLMGKLYSAEQCTALLTTLMATIKWSEDYCIIFGRRFDIPRLQAWYADKGIRYSYSNNLLKTQPWSESLLAVKNDVQEKTGHVFNSVLVTYYRNGSDHVTWHADDEGELGTDPVIASLSLGATRDFQFRHKHHDISGKVPLDNGDLLLMLPGFQTDWQHCIPSEPAITEPRINLTFRKVEPPC